MRGYIECVLGESCRFLHSENSVTAENGKKITYDEKPCRFGKQCNKISTGCPFRHKCKLKECSRGRRCWFVHSQVSEDIDSSAAEIKEKDEKKPCKYGKECRRRITGCPGRHECKYGEKCSLGQRCKFAHSEEKSKHEHKKETNMNGGEKNLKMGMQMTLMHSLAEEIKEMRKEIMMMKQQQNEAKK